MCVFVLQLCLQSVSEHVTTAILSDFTTLTKHRRAFNNTLQHFAVSTS